MSGTWRLSGPEENGPETKAGERSQPHPERHGYPIWSFAAIKNQIFLNLSPWRDYVNISEGTFILGSSSKAVVLKL